jgi:hypothetical protein
LVAKLSASPLAMEEHRVVADPDPRRAVVSHLTQPTAVQLPAHPTHPPGRPATRPTAFSSWGNPFTACVDSIQFLKERGTDDRRLFAVVFDDEAHNHWFWLAAAEFDGSAIFCTVWRRLPSRPGRRSRHPREPAGSRSEGSRWRLDVRQHPVAASLAQRLGV